MTANFPYITDLVKLKEKHTVGITAMFGCVCIRKMVFIRVFFLLADWNHKRGWPLFYNKVDRVNYNLTEQTSQNRIYKPFCLFYCKQFAFISALKFLFPIILFFLLVNTFSLVLPRKKFRFYFAPMDFVCFSATFSSWDQILFRQNCVQAKFCESWLN